VQSGGADPQKAEEEAARKELAEKRKKLKNDALRSLRTAGESFVSEGYKKGRILDLKSAFCKNSAKLRFNS
jgi:hypothetical protein